MNKQLDPYDDGVPTFRVRRDRRKVKRKRPGWITFLAAFLMYSGATGPLALILFDAPRGTPRYDTPFETILGMLACVLTFATGLALWQLRRRAMPLLLADTTATVVLWLIHLVSNVSYRSSFLTPRFLVTFVVGWVIQIAFLRYVWRLHREGVFSNA